MPSRVAVTGASGLLGRAVTTALTRDGYRVVPLVRRPVTEDAIFWDPDRGTISPEALEGTEAVIHLAGEAIADGRWTADRKRRIRHSRVAGTKLLAGTLAELAHPPAVLLSASAVGIYGDRGDEPLTETSAPGSGFLAEVASAWEAATAPAAAAGIRVVHLRFGMVLDPAGGALRRLLPAFRLGIGGPLGTGTQWVSWLTRDEVTAIVRHAMRTTTLQGPVNVVAPEAVTFRELARTLGRVLGRPAGVRVPAPILRLVFGELADTVLLASQRCRPAALLASGYHFQSPELEPALNTLLRSDR